MSWTPHITVAAIVEQQQKFLLVEEKVLGIPVYNQPAGHLEENESLIEAVVRETQEETGLIFQPEFITGLYHWQQADSRTTYIRLAFTGTTRNDGASPILDKQIIRKLWLGIDELNALPADKLRSSMVLHCIEDYLAGKRYPISLFTYLNERK